MTRTLFRLYAIWALGMAASGEVSLVVAALACFTAAFYEAAR